MGFKRVNQKDIDNSLSLTTRQYLVGNLKLPQDLQHIEDENVEIGITDYKTSSSEDAHTHSHATEYQYVLNGMTEYKDVQSGEVFRFIKGDFYIIYPNTWYIQRSKRDTRILFVKLPPGNDKVQLEAPEEMLEWAKNELSVKRMDLQGKDGPPVNSMVPATAAAIFNSKGELLLLKRKDSKNWTMPGGTMEISESLEQSIKREVKEETGINIQIETIIGTYTNPQNKVFYSDGEVRREFTVLFSCSSKDELSSVIIDNESLDYDWVAPSQIFYRPLANSQKQRLKDVQAFLKTKQTVIR